MRKRKKIWEKGNERKNESNERNKKIEKNLKK